MLSLFFFLVMLIFLTLIFGLTIKFEKFEFCLPKFYMYI